MSRRTYVALGVAFVVLIVAFFWTFDVPTGEPLTDLAAGCVLVTGLFFVLGGLREEITGGGVRIRWNHLIGIGDFFLAIAMALNGVDLALTATETGSQLIAVLVLFAAVVVAWIGYDFFRGGVYLDLSRYDSEE